jgi:hypothetical protein
LVNRVFRAWHIVVDRSNIESYASRLDPDDDERVYVSNLGAAPTGAGQIVRITVD